MTNRVATVPDFPVVFFTQQLTYFSPTGTPGLSHERHTVPEYSPDAIVDCLLWRGEDGTLLGILYYYPNDVPLYERAGNVNILVDPDRRREGIGTRLLAEAYRRWLLDFDTQDYTSAGLGLVTAYEERHHGGVDGAVNRA